MISYPLNFPVGVRIAGVRYIVMDAVSDAMSPFTLSEQVYDWGGDRWGLELTFTRMTRAEMEPLAAFVTALRGRWGSFLFGDPGARLPRGSVPGTPLVDGGSQTGRTISTKGWTASQTGILKAGDYIQLGSGANSRLHKVLVDTDSDGSGNADLEIWPKLRASPADEDSVTVRNTQGIWQVPDNQREWSYGLGMIGTFSLTAVERI